MPHDAFLRCYVFVRSLRSWGAHVSILIMRVIPGRRSEAEASPESILPDLWLWIPGSRPTAEPRNDWTKVSPEHACRSKTKASLELLLTRDAVCIREVAVKREENVLHLRVH